MPRDSSRVPLAEGEEDVPLKSLPLTPMIDGIRLIATEGKTLLDLAPNSASSPLGR